MKWFLSGFIIGWTIWMVAMSPFVLVAALRAFAFGGRSILGLLWVTLYVLGWVIIFFGDGPRRFRLLLTRVASFVFLSCSLFVAYFAAFLVPAAFVTVLVLAFAPVRSLAWAWLAVSSAPLAMAAVAAVLTRFGRMRGIPRLVPLVAALLGVAGAMVSSALLAGQIGQHFGEFAGRANGVFIGATLGPLLGWMTIAPFFSEALGKLSWEMRSRKQWVGLLVSIGLANAGVLWLLLGDGVR